jgi:hypothetical protein
MSYFVPFLASLKKNNSYLLSYEQTQYFRNKKFHEYFSFRLGKLKSKVRLSFNFDSLT